jgi:hypothetical protein
MCRADIRPTHGVHPLRNHRCRRAAELAGTATAREPDRGALRLLADSPLGATEAMMLAHCFTNAMLDVLVRDGLAKRSGGRCGRCGGGSRCRG